MPFLAVLQVRRRLMMSASTSPPPAGLSKIDHELHEYRQVPQPARRRLQSLIDTHTPTHTLASLAL